MRAGGKDHTKETPQIQGWVNTKPLQVSQSEGGGRCFTFLFFFLPMLYDLQDLSSRTRDVTQAISGDSTKLFLSTVLLGDSLTGFKFEEK